jgi:AcrR family transcriptional regulator
MRVELALLAQELFAAKGYHNTTLDDLVSAAGISKRTFFRYFASKEDLVLGKYDVWGERLVQAFTARPADEPVWASLRRTFDVVVHHFGDPAQLSHMLALEKVIQENSALSAGELERMARVQSELAAPIAQRMGALSNSDPRPSAVAGAALACLIAAKNVWVASDRTGPFSETLDEAMAPLGPVE